MHILHSLIFHCVKSGEIKNHVPVNNNIDMKYYCINKRVLENFDHPVCPSFR